MQMTNKIIYKEIKRVVKKMERNEEMRVYHVMADSSNMGNGGSHGRNLRGGGGSCLVLSVELNQPTVYIANMRLER